MSGTRFTRNAPARLTARTTSGRCASFTPGMTTEFTFTSTPRAASARDAVELPLGQDPRRLAPPDLAAAAEDPRVDPLADRGIDHVDRHRDVPDPERGEPLHVLGQREAVRGEAEREVRRGSPDALERRERGRGVRERVARPGDPDHRQLRDLGRDGEHLADRVLGRSRSDTTPGRLSFAQSYFRLQ